MENLVQDYASSTYLSDFHVGIYFIHTLLLGRCHHMCSLISMTVQPSQIWRCRQYSTTVANNTVLVSCVISTKISAHSAHQVHIVTYIDGIVRVMRWL